MFISFRNELREKTSLETFASQRLNGHPAVDHLGVSEQWVGFDFIVYIWMLVLNKLEILLAYCPSKTGGTFDLGVCVQPCLP